MKPTRRNFLARTTAAGVVSIGAAAPAFLNRAAWAAGEETSADKDGRILVLVELAGGNDGLNTVVPFADDAYRKARPGLGLDAGALLQRAGAAGPPPVRPRPRTQAASRPCATPISPNPTPPASSPPSPGARANCSCTGARSTGWPPPSTARA